MKPMTVIWRNIFCLIELNTTFTETCPIILTLFGRSISLPISSLHFSITDYFCAKLVFYKKASSLKYCLTISISVRLLFCCFPNSVQISNSD